MGNIWALFGKKKNIFFIFGSGMVNWALAVTAEIDVQKPACRATSKQSAVHSGPCTAVSAETRGGALVSQAAVMVA